MMCNVKHTWKKKPLKEKINTNRKFHTPVDRFTPPPPRRAHTFPASTGETSAPNQIRSGLRGSAELY